MIEPLSSGHIVNSESKSEENSGIINNEEPQADNIDKTENKSD
jgi:hypothetical protein